jgi:hypothetical protein
MMATFTAAELGWVIMEGKEMVKGEAKKQNFITGLIGWV